MGENTQRLGLKVTFPLLCPQSPGLGPRSLLGYLIVDSLVSQAVQAFKGSKFEDIFEMTDHRTPNTGDAACSPHFKPRGILWRALGNEISP
jgi:hypothetical protein